MAEFAAKPPAGPAGHRVYGMVSAGIPALFSAC